VAHVRDPLRDAAALRGVVQEEVLKGEVLEAVMRRGRTMLQDRGSRVRQFKGDQGEEGAARERFQDSRILGS
jgi:hypothetical protein